MNLLIVGATGLVGQGVLRAALQAPEVDGVSVLSRHALPVTDPRMKVLVLGEFRPDLLAALALGGFDACLYCAGVLPIGRGEAAYRTITVDMTCDVAHAFALANPGARFVYVSGAGANPNSRLMPLRVKGQAEVALQRLPLACVMMRPAIVRPTEGATSPYPARRLAYTLAQPFLAIANVMAPGLLTTTDQLGRAMVRACTGDMPTTLVENAAINKLAASTSR
jgi:uncharacterized protein YbjT (DUF2867 family)